MCLYFKRVMPLGVGDSRVVLTYDVTGNIWEATGLLSLQNTSSYISCSREQNLNLTGGISEPISTCF